MAQERLVELGKTKTMKERGKLPSEEGNVVRKYKAMHQPAKGR